MIQKIREWFFQVFFGIKLNEFILGNIQASSLRNDITELQEVYTSLLVEWNRLNSDCKIMREEIRDIQQGAIVMNKNTADIATAVGNNLASIKSLTELGNIHNKTLDHIVSKLSQQPEQTTPSSNTTKLN